jgi:uncharacterized protein
MRSTRSAELNRALALCERHPALGARDAMLAAITLNRGIGAILTADRGFDEVPGLRRVDPLDAAAVASVCG